MSSTQPWLPRPEFSRLFQYGVIVPVFGRNYFGDKLKKACAWLRFKRWGLTERQRKIGLKLPPCVWEREKKSKKNRLHCNRNRVCPYCWFRNALLPLYRIIKDVCGAGQTIYCRQFSAYAEFTTYGIQQLLNLKRGSRSYMSGTSWVMWLSPEKTTEGPMAMFLRGVEFSLKKPRRRRGEDEDEFAKRRKRYRKVTPDNCEPDELTKAIATLVPFPSGWLRATGESTTALAFYLQATYRRRMMNFHSLRRACAKDRKRRAHIQH